MKQVYFAIIILAMALLLAFAIRGFTCSDPPGDGGSPPGAGPGDTPGDTPGNDGPGNGSSASSGGAGAGSADWAWTYRANFDRPGQDFADSLVEHEPDWWLFRWLGISDRDPTMNHWRLYPQTKRYRPNRDE